MRKINRKEIETGATRVLSDQNATMEHKKAAQEQLSQIHRNHHNTTDMQLMVSLRQPF